MGANVAAAILAGILLKFVSAILPALFRFHYRGWSHHHLLYLPCVYTAMAFCYCWRLSHYRFLRASLMSNR